METRFAFCCADFELDRTHCQDLDKTQCGACLRLYKDHKPPIRGDFPETDTVSYSNMKFDPKN